jgi:hypothetical protein
MFHEYDLRSLPSDERKTHRSWMRRITLFYAGLVCLLLAVAVFTPHATSSGSGEATKSEDPQQRQASFKARRPARGIQFTIPSCDNDPSVRTGQCSLMLGDQSP